MGGKGLLWSRLPWNQEVQPHPALCLSRALLQPKQGRSSNLLRVGSSSRSRVSLIRLPSLIIPRELVGAVSLAPALRAPLPAPRVPRCMALPVLCQGLSPKARRAVIPGSYICSKPGGGEVLGWPGPGKGFKHHQKGDKRLLHCKMSTFN